jgi:LysM repeat protein
VTYDSPVRSRRLGPAGAVTAALLGACSDEEPGAAETLPPIITTTSTSTTLAPADTVPRFYEVQRGDTLTAIAATYGLPIETIMAANGITDQNNIQVGQILQLPSPDIVPETRPRRRRAVPSTSAP